MATPYTQKNGKETRGESLVYDKFKSLLADPDYLLFHNQVLPGTDREIDFIIVHPTYGVWVIEIKDWSIDQVRVIDTDKVELRKGRILGLGRTSIVRNPLKQARDNLIYLKDSFQKHRNLLHQVGDHQGKLLVPINSFAIFSNISRAEIENSESPEFFPVNKVWTKDVLEDPYLQEDQFEKLLLDTREFRFQCNLDDGQLSSVKRCIGVAAVSPNTPPAPSEEVQEETEVGTLDEYQNRLVQHKIESQIAIEGPAGSGKSVVLLQRAIHIHREYPHWKVGVVCFNALMANCLRTMLERETKAAAVGSEIDVFDIYDWVKSVGLKSRNVKGLRNEELLKEALDDAGWKLETQYDALLVDEGQDATDVLLRLYRAMLLQDDCSLTFFYDRHQVLYQGSVVDKLNAYGFDVEEKQLVKQQRSSLVILALAFYKRLHEGAEPEHAIEGSLIAAEKWFAGFRRWASAKLQAASNLIRKIWRSAIPGGKRRPEIVDLGKELEAACGIFGCSDSYDLAKHIETRIFRAVEAKEFAFSEICVLFPSHTYAPGMPDGSKDRLRRLLTEMFQKARIPYTYIDFDNGHLFDGSTKSTVADNRRTADLQSDSVKLMTIHTSKGLDGKLVLVAGFDGIDKLEFRSQMGYVALTRAKSRCEIYYCSPNESVNALVEVLRLLKLQKLQMSH